MKNDEKTEISEQLSNDLSYVASWAAASTFALTQLMDGVKKMIDHIETIQ